jgi:two-component system nitrate/nitrite sensor histidine kinase NarX
VNGLSDFFLNALSQFAGGPGPPENNLVRFGLAASLWGVLLAIAWNRQREQRVERERLLVVGFGLALFRELFMLGHLSTRLISGQGHNISCSIVAPIEHGLTLASVILIAGSFVRYISDDASKARRYLRIGAAATALALAIAFVSWPAHLAVDPEIRFHQTWPASLLHLVGVVMIAFAIAVLVTHRSWLRNVVIMALGLLFLSELAVLVNFVTGHQFSRALCPIGNGIYLLAIPLFGFVYFHEQAEDKRQADRALEQYREHLEDLVRNRTVEIAQRNAELAAQNTIAATISQSLELETVLESAMQKILSLFRMSWGCFLLADGLKAGMDGQRHAVFHSSNGAGHPCHRPKVLRDIAENAEHRLKLVHETLDLYGEICPEEGETDACWQVVGVPLIAEGRAVGALLLGSEYFVESSAIESDLLISIGQQIGVAVEKAMLVKQLEKTAVLEERQRIAAEVHDGLAQTLSYLGLRTDDARDMLADLDAEQMGAILADIRESLGQASHEVRQSIASLASDPEPPKILQTAIAEVVNGNVPGSDKVVQFFDELDETIEMEQGELEQIVRVVQEAITNAQRHARAAEIRVHLARRSDCIQVRVEDDGQGFDLALVAASDGEHFGLNLMQARAARINADLTVDSQPGSGTRIILAWPRH